MRKVIVIGAGAAGFFTAINLAEMNDQISVTVLEKSNTVLGKVKVSGGGRCNVTHSCFEPKELVSYYPRGGKELLGPFFSFQPLNTIDWFEQRGVQLKTEEDGRMFPVTNDSQTIIDCFLNAADNGDVQVKLKEGVTSVEAQNDQWLVTTTEDEYLADDIIIASGSASKVWQLLDQLGHQIVPPVPSLFTFNIHDKALQSLAGLSIENVQVSIKNHKAKSTGPLLFTHWGLSAPSILKLSAAEARYLNEQNYQFEIAIDFLPTDSIEQVVASLEGTQQNSTKNLYNHNPFNFPKRFWNYLLNEAEVTPERIWPELRKQEKKSIVTLIKSMSYQVDGKSTFKEEFVTAGGLDLKQVNFKTMESKVCKGLYFAGEVLNIDGFTGGFNFQAAWTTSFLAATSISKKV